MSQRRNRRAGVEDLWFRRDRVTGEKVESKRHGQGKRWRARWIDPAGQEKTKAFERKTDAQTHIDSVTTQLTTHTYVDPKAGRLTVGTAVQRYLDGLQVGLKARDDYASVARSRILPRWAETPLDAVVTSDVATWLRSMQQGEDKVSPARARKAGLVLRSSLQLAVDDRLLAVNPARNVKLPRVPKRREGVRLTASELQRVAGEMPTDTDRLLLLTLALCGLRWGEATALQVKALDFERMRVTVSRTYIDLNGEISEGVPKSHASRWVPLPASLGEELQKLVKGKDPEDDVFRGRHGAVFRHRNWGRRAFRSALREAGCDDAMRIHDLRGTFASLAIQAGANIKALQRALGHESAALTLDTYGFLYPDDLAGLGSQIETAAYSLRTEDPEEKDSQGQNGSD